MCPDCPVVLPIVLVDITLVLKLNVVKNIVPALLLNPGADTTINLERLESDPIATSQPNCA